LTGSFKKGDVFVLYFDQRRLRLEVDHLDALVPISGMSISGIVVLELDP